MVTSIDVEAVKELIEKWNIPVYAHQLELPFLTGKEDYPEPDYQRLKVGWWQKNVVSVS